ncbi:Terpenoid cyclases/protein prenyltransferase alpha-alpha toroid [Parasponia andersonii]|uniref:Terpenoid cyclases/protein prenyltransferase alpha-alpha toroid n=1 Tax=Parasponia andersonii TaxID=3476 RepID=A0A2P5CIU3_PARAD|nr:Terpenoid cyclases/protein prenyltransferase alpha-alpha toroid [Parasponia andersonii]
MWKIKYGTGAEDPYLFSTNNFMGRQIFEFDPNAGTPEERAQVEEARQNFYRNRYQVKPCSDHIWRLQIEEADIDILDLHRYIWMDNSGGLI